MRIANTSGHHNPIAGYIEHLLMDPEINERDTVKGCQLARIYQVASVCVKPCYIRRAVSSLNGSDVKVSTIVGFPFGFQSTCVKVAEAKRALTEGAQELEMIVNIGYLLDQNDYLFGEDIREICGIAHLNGVLIKVVLETGYLEDELIKKASRIAFDNGADWISTSSGYIPLKSQHRHIALIQEACTADIKIKSALVTCSPNDFIKLRNLGCSLIGTSSTKAILDVNSIH